MTNMTITIAKDFSRYPAGRYRNDGPYSGEKFRDDMLAPTLALLGNGERLHILMDGVRGYGSSFLEEAFGGLMRLQANLTPELFWKKVEVVTEDASLKAEITEYIADARNA